MAIDSSKFFDSIRIKPNKLSAKQQAAAREEAVMCEAPGCKNKGGHRAPKGRGHEKEYWHFCLNHVREYNQSYNFFQGMNADAVARYQKDALTGHRPTWKMGANTSSKKGKGSPEADLEGAVDPFSMFSELNGRGRWRPGPGAGTEAKVHCAVGMKGRDSCAKDSVDRLKVATCEDPAIASGGHDPWPGIEAAPGIKLIIDTSVLPDPEERRPEKSGGW